MADGEPSPKKSRHSIISRHLFTPEFQETFHKNWQNLTAFEDENIEFITEPFRVCKISNFLHSEEYMDDLKNELIDVKVRRDSNDLFQLERSEDLSVVKKCNIEELHYTFKTELKDWMEKNTEIELGNEISMASSCYSDTDYLLCHDDNLGDRRIAFILYLSKGWEEEYGGALGLFDTDEHDRPRNVVRSFLPEYNSLVFFEVVHNSYHQVAEVLSMHHSRWSINGWFHGPIVALDRPPRPEPEINYIEPQPGPQKLSKWINTTYLRPRMMLSIQKRVEDLSHVFLKDYVNKDVYKVLRKEIQSADINWTWVGPADVRHYEVADENSLPQVWADFCKFLKSKKVFQLMKKYTELDLVATKEDMHPKVNIEVQRWSTGCYTLMTDKNVDGNIGEIEDAEDSEEDDGIEVIPEEDTTVIAVEDNDVIVVEDEQIVSENYNEVVIEGYNETVAEYDNEVGGKFDDESDIEVYSEKDTTVDTSSRDKNEAFGEQSSSRMQNSIYTPPSSHGDDEEVDQRDEVNEEEVKQQQQQQQEHEMQMKEEEEDEVEMKEEDREEEVRKDQRKKTRKNKSSAAASRPAEQEILEDEFMEDELLEDEASEDEYAIKELADYDLAEESSDIEDYMSDVDPSTLKAAGNSLPGSLDVILQLNVEPEDKPPEEPGKETIPEEYMGYLDPRLEEPIMTGVPAKENHLFLVYRMSNCVRWHKYVNHYFKGYRYNLICTYIE